ncbi:MAG: hypothetical protein V3V25_12090 [Paracoccaceae bacterium]
MKDETYQIIGLVGFILAGLIFIAVGLRSGDFLTVLGSIIWTVSCVIWMIPIIHSRK